MYVVFIADRFFKKWTGSSHVCVSCCGAVEVNTTRHLLWAIMGKSYLAQKAVQTSISLDFMILFAGSAWGRELAQHAFFCHQHQSSSRHKRERWIPGTKNNDNHTKPWVVIGPWRLIFWCECGRQVTKSGTTTWVEVAVAEEVGRKFCKFCSGLLTPYSSW